MSDHYQPLTFKMKVLIVVLTLATATTVMLSMVSRPGNAPVEQRALPPDVARCAPGQTSGCVGGTAAVIALPANAASAEPAKVP